MPRFPTLLPTEVHEVFPKAFILLNIQGSTSAYAYSALAVSPKLRDLVNPRKKSKSRPPIATFIHVCLRNKDKKSKFPMRIRRSARKTVNSRIQRKRRYVSPCFLVCPLHSSISFLVSSFSPLFFSVFFIYECLC